MKKTRLYLALVLVSTLFLFGGCSKKSDNKVENCDALSQTAVDAATAFGANPTEATCQAYVNAIQDLYDGCSTISASAKQAYDQFLASADCSGFPQ